VRQYVGYPSDSLASCSLCAVMPVAAVIKYNRYLNTEQVWPACLMPLSFSLLFALSKLNAYKNINTAFNSGTGTARRQKMFLMAVGTGHEKQFSYERAIKTVFCRSFGRFCRLDWRQSRRRFCCQSRPRNRQYRQLENCQQQWRRKDVSRFRCGYSVCNYCISFTCRIKFSCNASHRMLLLYWLLTCCIRLSLFSTNIHADETFR